MEDATAVFCTSKIRFFFERRISRASGSKAGAISTSKKISLIAAAVALSTATLQASTPPKALSGSPASALSHASFNVDRIATPARIGMLDYGKDGLLAVAEFPDQLNRRIDIHQVIIG